MSVLLHSLRKTCHLDTQSRCENVQCPPLGYEISTVLITAAIHFLQVIRAALFPYYLARHWAIAVGLVSGFFVTGVIIELEHIDDRLERLARNLGQLGYPS